MILNIFLNENILFKIKSRLNTMNVFNGGFLLCLDLNLILQLKKLQFG